MAVDRSRGAEETRRRLELEGRFARDYRSVERAVARRVIASLARDGVLPDTREFSIREVEPVLASHYSRVAEPFSRDARGRLPADVEATDEESGRIDEAIAAHLAILAPARAREIAATNADDARVATSAAEAERERLAAEEGVTLARPEFAVLAGRLLDARLRARTPAIAVTETSVAAEAAKLLEVEVLLGGDPSALGGVGAAPSRGTREVKEWVTQGDSKVRAWHAAVDSQRVPASEPFLVRGQRLMHPGDTSLGATADNVVNCRCQAQYDVEVVARDRRARGRLA